MPAMVVIEVRKMARKRSRTAWMAAGRRSLPPASPGVLLPPGSLRLRIGPTLRLGGATALRNGGGLARVLTATPGGAQALFRIGGLELETGVDVTLWVPRA